MIGMLPQIASLCVFACRIKILDGNPCAGLIVHTKYGTMQLSSGHSSLKAMERPKKTLKCPLEKRDLDTNDGKLLLK